MRQSLRQGVRQFQRGAISNPATTVHWVDSVISRKDWPLRVAGSVIAEVGTVTRHQRQAHPRARFVCSNYDTGIFRCVRRTANLQEIP